LTVRGCGSGPATFDVTGKVTLDGKPIEKGRIQFRELGGQLRAFGADIVNGEYSIETAGGAMSVTVTAAREVPGKFQEGPGGADDEKVPVIEMYVPKSYNTETTLKTEVSRSESNVFNVEMKSEDS